MRKRSRINLVAAIILPICALIFQSCKRTNSAGVLVSIASVSPRHGISGTLVTITGTGFVSDTSQENASMGNIIAPIVAANSYQMVVIVPVNIDSAKLDSVIILVAVQGAVVQGGYFTYDNANVGANDVTTFAGSGTAGSADGTGIAATFKTPENGAFDRNGNLFIADYGNNEIRKVTPAGVVTTFAGSTTAGYKDGPGLQALFSGPAGLAFDSKGNLYVSDQGNNRIRKIDPAGAVTTYAGNGSTGNSDGHGVLSSFNGPIGIAIDTIGGNIFIADAGNNEIREIHLLNDSVSTIAGSIGFGSTDGAGYLASFSSPRGVTVASSGSGASETVYVIVSDYQNNKIREVLITQSGSLVTTLAGNPTNASGFSITSPVSFDNPNGTALGYSRNGLLELFIADASNHCIRDVPSFDLNSLSLTNVPVLTGTGNGLRNGSYSNAQFNFPDGVVYNPMDGNLYVIEFGNNDIRKIILH